jgi:type I restriction enzyme R subunit
VADGWLVPAKSVSVPLKFEREGIRYDDLSEDEKEAWDAVEWDEDGAVPAIVEPAALNKWLFNADTVDKVLEHLMVHGQKVEGGDRLAKTIIFAKTQDHARFIVQRFDANYPQYAGSFARSIVSSDPYAQTLLDDFSDPRKAPHIAVSVDMLDTGVDVPEVANLVFFKIVRSKTTFWQMLGRGTRLCPDLFGPGEDKRFFSVFDFCQNFEFFNQNPQIADPAIGESLSHRLFASRVELIGVIDAFEAQAAEATAGYPASPSVVSETREFGEAQVNDLRALRTSLADTLRAEVSAMSLDNFLVRPKRRAVETYAKPEAWMRLDGDARAELVHDLAGLPSGAIDEDTAAKQFDVLILRGQLALLRAETAFADIRARIIEVAGDLEAISNIPMVAREMELILEIQTEDWWRDVTAPMLETVRRRLRSLIKLIEVKRRQIVYTDFEDEIGAPTEVALRGLTGLNVESFRAKALHFLRANDDHIAVQKLRRNEPLTTLDLAELERIMIEAGVADPDDLAKVRADGGLGLFVRSLVGLDRAAAQGAFAGFLAGRTLNADQMQFVAMVIDHLTERGAMAPELLYESPFTDFDPLGIAGVFDDRDTTAVISILDEVRRRAAA